MLRFHRTDSMGEVKDQRMHPLVLAPKVPGRFYFVFGKPIETRGTDSKTFHYIPSICILKAFSQCQLLTWLLTMLDTDKCTCV